MVLNQYSIELERFEFQKHILDIGTKRNPFSTKSAKLPLWKLSRRIPRRTDVPFRNPSSTINAK